MNHDELQAWLRLLLTPGIGNASAHKLLGAFGLPQGIFEQPHASLTQVVSTTQAQALRRTPEDLPALLTRTWDWLCQDDPQGVPRRILTLGDAGYPQALLRMDDPPLMLYALGEASFAPAPESAETALASDPAGSHGATIDAQRCLAMVGSRNPTPQGARNARQFAKALAQAGLTIVSGLALGVDGAAHEGALESLGPEPERPARAVTIAVVGTGLDRVYPKAHHALAHRIARHGLILSEYPLGTPPLNTNFPRRNRLIAGLSQGTLVVEAALKSGSLITARLAVDQGKEVFAIPGSIHAAQSRGCHALIRQGAKLVESAQDVLEELGGASAPATSVDPEPAEASTRAHTDAREHLLLQALGFDPVGLDALQARTGLEAPELQASLMTLELEGLLARLPGGLFQRLADPD